jgi:transposase InsO family protein
MHSKYKGIGVRVLCELFGKTRHAYYDRIWSETEWERTKVAVLAIVAVVRRRQPKLGTRRLYHKIEGSLANNDLKVGRDTLHEILLDAGMTIKVKRRIGPRTTDSNHGFPLYPNLVKGVVPTGPNQQWVSDITYLSLTDCFCFLSLVTDAYSHMIVGYNLSLLMTAEQTIVALEMALATLPEGDIDLIHHSDRGSQYACYAHTGILIARGIRISMTEDSDPRDNGIAERVNGILKDEQGLEMKFGSFEEAWEKVQEAIEIYNYERPHGSIDYLSPAEAHKMSGPIPKRWKYWHQRKGRQDVPA